MNINFGCRLYIQSLPKDNPKRLLTGESFSVADVLAQGEFKCLPWRGKGCAREYELKDGTRLWSADKLILGGN